MKLTFIRSKRVPYIIGVVLGTLLISTWVLSRHALEQYEELLSIVISDRNGVPISIQENSKGHYALSSKTLPPAFEKFLLFKEDQFFYTHPGVNVVGMGRALVRYLVDGKSGGSSTLTEQLSKNLLGTETNRSIPNKLRELAYTISLELFLSKETILTMYSNTVYLGNQIQGFETASWAYFDKPLQETTTHEQAMLLATLSYPASRNPWKESNEAYARALYTRFTEKDAYVAPPANTTIALQNQSRFELQPMHLGCSTSCSTTIDTKVTSDLRAILKRTVLREHDRGVRNGAIVVIDPRTSELIAMVGSPDPTQVKDGGQIQMALEPRPIGSTIKPFVYLFGFMQGLRPYTLVDDREYKYPIATGYSLYPKNYDGKYHGEVTLHHALSNSLNVPSVKILEYISLPYFYDFLEQTLRFRSIQPLDSYQYGIALGGLEMDLLTLTHYFTLFPREGTLEPLRILLSSSTVSTPPQSSITKHTVVSSPEYTELVTTILSDRLSGVEQFGLTSNLNLTNRTYAVKTGTSRDFHDSWVIGYTPDFVVGVWLGNSENQPLAQVSGQSGAGSVWHDVMEYLLSSPYASDRTFTNEHVQTIPIENSLEWGLPQDSINEHRNLLIEKRLITSIHEGDMFAYEERTTIPLRASESVIWSVNGAYFTEGAEVLFSPTTSGNYEIEATTKNGDREILTIVVTNPSL